MTLATELLAALVPIAMPHFANWQAPPGFEGTFADWFESPEGNLLPELLARRLEGLKDASAFPGSSPVALLAANDAAAPKRARKARPPREPYRPPPERVAAITDLDRARARKALRAIGCVDARGGR